MCEISYLWIEKQVAADDGDADCDDGEDHEHQQHESVHEIDLVRPERREHKVHFNEDRAEWKQSPGKYDDPGLHKPTKMVSWFTQDEV